MSNSTSFDPAAVFTMVPHPPLPTPRVCNSRTGEALAAFHATLSDALRIQYDKNAAHIASIQAFIASQYAADQHTGEQLGRP